MREILFKAKRKDNGKWIEGYYAVIGAKDVIIKAQAEDYYSVDENVKKSHGNEVIEVDPSTVCQYTGLTDKNNRKIFEGDILKSDLDKVGKIAYNESHMAFLILEDKENKYYYIQECDRNHVEVIGNIFDHPELMEPEA